MITIYKITNRLNRKIYIGQTRQLIEKCFLQRSKATTPLGNAMRDCGLENFTIEVIEECETQEQANEREQFWIKILNCKVPNGYNQKDGGSVGYYRRQSTLSTMTLRLKMLRKKLKKTQSEFGAAIGLKQRTISEIESGSANLTERNFKSICEKFNVNPEWLRYGIGDMFLPEKVDTYLDKVVAEKKLSPQDKALIKSILELPPEARKAFVDWTEKLAETIRVDAKEQAKEDERRALEKTIQDAQRRLDELNAPTKKRSNLTKEEVSAIIEAEIEEAAKAQGVSLK